MIDFPSSTAFGRRIPKQKFYENLSVTPTLRRVFIDQISTVIWRNKIAASTANITQGETVTELEVFEIRLSAPELDQSVLQLIDREIPYHILFVLTYEGQAQAWIQCLQGIRVLSYAMDAGGSIGPSDGWHHHRRHL